MNHFVFIFVTGSPTLYSLTTPVTWRYILCIWMSLILAIIRFSKRWIKSIKDAHGHCSRHRRCISRQLVKWFLYIRATRGPDLTSRPETVARETRHSLARRATLGLKHRLCGRGPLLYTSVSMATERTDTLLVILGGNSLIPEISLWWNWGRQPRIWFDVEKSLCFARRRKYSRQQQHEQTAWRQHSEEDVHADFLQNFCFCIPLHLPWC